MASDADHLSRRCSKQRRGLFQVRCVDTLGEPVVDLSQQLSGFVAFALALPPPTQLIVARSSNAFPCWRRAPSRA